MLQAGRIGVEFQQQLTLFYGVALGSMGGEVLAVEVHGVEADMDEQVDAIVRVEPQGVFGIKENRDGAIKRRIDLALRSLYGCAAAHGLSQHDDVFHSRPGYHPSEHRWGHGGASIIDFLVSTPDASYPSRIESNTQTEFYFTVRFDSDFDQVVPGFLLKTLEGIFLYGTNSYLSSRGTAHHSAQAGSVQTYRFSMPMALNEGHYLVSFGISSGDPRQDLVPLDRRYDSVLIHVGRDVQFWGIADLRATYQQLNA